MKGSLTIKRILLMSSQRVVHDVAQQMENSDNLPCFSSLSLNERTVTKGLLPKTQSIEAPKRDSNGNIIPNLYTQQKHDENMKDIKTRNAKSLWSDFYDENVRPENVKNDGSQNKWPPNIQTNGMIPHFLQSDWAEKKGACPVSIKEALDTTEMKEWVTQQDEAIKSAYELARNEATTNNLIQFRVALVTKTVKGLPIPPGFVHYTYMRKLTVGVSNMPTKFLENKYFGPKWEDWIEATNANGQHCEMRNASSTRDAWTKFLGVYQQDQNVRNRKVVKNAPGQQPEEEIYNSPPQQTPSNSGNEKGGDDDDKVVDGFFAQSPSSPPNSNDLLKDLGPLAPPAQQDPPQNDELDIPPAPKGDVPINQDDILNLLNQLPK